MIFIKSKLTNIKLVKQKHKQRNLKRKQIEKIHVYWFFPLFDIVGFNS